MLEIKSLASVREWTPVVQSVVRLRYPSSWIVTVNTLKIKLKGNSKLGPIPHWRGPNNCLKYRHSQLQKLVLNWNAPARLIRKMCREKEDQW
jgi:hypothetical protein